MQLILLLFKITIKDNEYVSRQLDQQYEEKKMQYRKAFQFKAIVKKKRKNSLCSFFGNIPQHIQVCLTVFLFKFCQIGD